MRCWVLKLREWQAAAGAEVEGYLCARGAAVGEALLACRACTSAVQISAWSCASCQVCSAQLRGTDTESSRVCAIPGPVGVGQYLGRQLAQQNPPIPRWARSDCLLTGGPSDSFLRIGCKLLCTHTGPIVAHLSRDGTQNADLGFRVDSPGFKAGSTSPTAEVLRQWPFPALGPTCLGVKASSMQAHGGEEQA